MRVRSAAQRGFTILELATVVAIIGVLAAIVIPNWARTARNKKYDPEVTAMFTEISTREAQYKQEQGNGTYLTVAQCPSAPDPSGIDFNTTCVTSGSDWAKMGVNPSDSSIRCTYEITTGLDGDAPVPPGACLAAPASLAGSWYYVVATCDMDGNGGTDATFCISSWNNQQSNANYGS